MAKCDICAKAGQSGNSVSHSKRRTRTRWTPNIQRATIEDRGERRRVNICTRCLRTHYKTLVKG